MRAHAISGGDLSSTGYAKAADCSLDQVRSIAAKYGLPITLGARPHAKSASSTSTQTTDAGSPDADDSSAPNPTAEGAPVTREEVGKLVQAHVRAATQTGPSMELTVRDPNKAAMQAASARVARMHVDSVVSTSTLVQTQDEEAGEMVRRFWNQRFSGLFDSPGAMVEDMAVFYWENRDLLPALQEQLEAAVAQIDELARQFDPETRRREAVDQVWAMALTAAVAGRPLSREDVAYYIQVAEALATHSPVPDPPSSVPVVPSREGDLTVIRGPLHPNPGLTMHVSAADPRVDAFVNKRGRSPGAPG